MDNENDKDPDESKELNRESHANFQESTDDASETSRTNRSPSPEEYEREKQKATSSFRKRHFVDEDPKDPSKRRRTDLMQLIVRNLEQTYGINWQNHVPIEILYSDESGRLILQLYDLMDEEAQDRLNQIKEKGFFEPKGYKKGSKKKGHVLKGVVNTMIGSVQRELAFRFYQDRVFVERSHFNQLPQNNTGQYFHMNDEFTRPSEPSRPRPIELNDQNNVHIEMDPTEVNQVDPNVYIGDDTDDNFNPKKN